MPTPSPLPVPPLRFPCQLSVAHPPTTMPTCTCTSTCAATSLSVPAICSPPTHNYTHMHLHLYLRRHFAFRACHLHVANAGSQLCQTFGDFNSTLQLARIASACTSARHIGFGVIRVRTVQVRVHTCTSTCAATSLFVPTIRIECTDNYAHTCTSTCAATSLFGPSIGSPPTHNYAHMHMDHYLRRDLAFRAHYRLLTQAHNYTHT